MMVEFSRTKCGFRRGRERAVFMGLRAAATAARDRSPVAAATSEPGRLEFPAPPQVCRRCGRGPPARRSVRGARRVPGRSAWDAKGAVESSDDLLAACALPTRTPSSRPGGTPEEISRGQVRPSGRRPRKRRGFDPCPSGASKKMARGDEEGGNVAGIRLKKLLRCPAGAWPVRRRNRGPRPLRGLAPG